MSNLRYSQSLLRNLNRTNIRPIFVMEIDGVNFLIGSDTIKRIARYGDDGLVYGLDDLVYGGLYALRDQKALISLDATTTSIKQELAPDKARGSSISSLKVRLVDINDEATKLASGAYGGEVLYKDVKVWVGFTDESDFNKDFIMIFRGIVESTSAGQGYVDFNLSSPDQKRRQSIALKLDTELDGAINNSVTELTLNSVEGLIEVPDHPSYSNKDDDLKTYVKINDEYIQYEYIDGKTLKNCTRAQLGSSAASHGDDDSVESFYRLEGNSLELALKIMLSDKDLTPYIENLDATSVNQTPAGEVENSIFFSGIDMKRDYNVFEGDWIKSESFGQGANNLSTWTKILGVQVLDAGTYIVVDATLSDEPEASGNVTFLSQWNSLGDFGLNMDTDEVDIEKHIFLRDTFLLNSDQRFNLREEIEEVKEFIELNLYYPFACYSLPADKAGLARISVGYHVAPLPIEQIVEVNKTNVVNPDNITTKRSINRYHYNVVGYVYSDAPDDEEFRKKKFVIVGTQLIPTGNKTLKIEAPGFRDDLGAQAQATRAATRLLDRYKGAAEVIPGMNVEFSTGVRINIGDIVVFNPEGLNVINRTNNDREKSPLLMEVLNKDVDIRTGRTRVDLIDTSFDIDARYGLVAPTSKITKALSQRKFSIAHPIGSEYSKYGIFEGRKWQEYVGARVIIHNADYSDSFATNITSVSDNIMVVDDPPGGFTITDGDYFISLGNYSDQTDIVKLVFAFLSDGSSPFADGEDPYIVL